jgi:hypothetical protein
MFETAHTTRIPERPDRGPRTEDEKRWDAEAGHFLVTFQRRERAHGRVVAQMSTYYSMGSGHRLKGTNPNANVFNPPSAHDVMDALLSDAESWDNARPIGASSPDVDTFARELGYDEDHSERFGAREERLSLMQRAERARRAFEACGKTFADLNAFFGADGFEALRRCERL